MKNSLIYKNYEKLASGQTNYEAIVQEKLTLCNQSIQNKDNVVLDLYSDESLQMARALANNKRKHDIYTGVTFLVKDNVNFKGHKTTSASFVCKDFISPYNATIIDNILDNQGIILGKVNLDELAHAGTGTWSRFGIVVNPIDKTRIVGGSSSGSVAAIKLGLCDVAIGTDTGDSIRHPASFLGVVGFKPSYGVVSRYGVTPFASSLDHIGVITNSIVDAAIGMDMIKGIDYKDSTSIDLDSTNFYDALKLEDKKYKFLVLTDVLSYANETIQKQFNKFISDLEQVHQVDFVEFDKQLLPMLMPLYMSTSYFEGLTNWDNVNGITFGGKDINYKTYKDLAYQARSKFGSEVKNRYMIANLFYNDNDFDTVYENSKKIRRIIVNRTNELLENYDAILIPSASSYAPLVQDTLNRNTNFNYCDDALTLANFAGLPSISLPITNPNNKMPLDINLTGKKFSDIKLLNIAYNLEDFIQNKGFYNE